MVCCYPYKFGPDIVMKYVCDKVDSETKMKNCSKYHVSNKKTSQAMNEKLMTEKDDFFERNLLP